jgi:hypothetical protein
MKHVKIFEEFEELKPQLSKEQRYWIIGCVKRSSGAGSWTYDARTGLVDVYGDFVCADQGLEDFKGVRFGVIRGEFVCSDNKLTSLDGAPSEVGLGFSCSNNNLTSLEGGPKKVGHNYYCFDNKLTSLEGAPDQIYGNFECDRNSLTTLEGGPEFVKVTMSCEKNQLTSLIGAPRSIGKNFHCSFNQLTSVEGFPKYLNGTFYCYNNPVSQITLKTISEQIVYNPSKSYLEIIESIWQFIPQEDQIFVYSPDFKWLTVEDHKKYSALRRLEKIKGLV